MTRNKYLLMWAAAIAMTCSLPAKAQSPAQHQEIRNSFVRLGPGVPGVLYEPVSYGPKSEIAVFVMHTSGDYLEHSACANLSRRGYRVLCANNSNSKAGSETDLNMDRTLLDAKLGVAWLRKHPGVRKVVLLGHSGGGVLMSTYQAVAENGLKACQGPEKIFKCADNLTDLPAADGLLLLDANYGISTMTLFSIDPAVLDEASGRKVDPKLDLFNPQNGFNADGAKYSDAFARRFQAAVTRRYNQLIKAAQQRVAALDAGKGRFTDDEVFVVPGASYIGGNNKFFAQDPRFLSHTRNAWPLVHRDGSVTSEVVHTVRTPLGMKSMTGELGGGALKTTARRFLGTYAIRVDDSFGYTEDTIRGVDWTSSYTTPIGNVRNVNVPLLTLGMTAGYEFMAAELIYENARSADKSIAFIEGATHGVATCTRCEKTPGQYGDTIKTTYDYIDGWLSKPGRF